MRGRPTSPIRLAGPIFVGVILVVGFMVACVLDRPVFRVLDWPDAEREDWHKALRVMGFIPVWLVAGLVVALLMRDEGHRWRASGRAFGFLVALSAVLAGLLAEPAKLLFRRERPDASLMQYVFRPWDESPWSSAGLGLPSSHVMIAFAGATALSMAAPRVGFIWFGLACGCAFTRLADRAHWLSDVYAGAALGVLAAWALARMLGVRRGVA